MSTSVYQTTHLEASNHQFESELFHVQCHEPNHMIWCTRSLGALRDPTSSWGPFGPWLRPSRPSGAQAARPTQVTHPPNPPKKIWQFAGNIEVRWWEILLEALEKSIWPCLRNTVRREVTRIFCDTDRGGGGGIGHSSSLIIIIFFRKYRSQVVRNTLRTFGEIHLTMFEKYSKNRSDPDFLWQTDRQCRNRAF